MAQKKYASLSTLQNLTDKIKELFATKTDLNTELAKKANSSHTHSIADTTNLQSTLDSKVPTSRTINSKPLSANITLSASDVGAAPSTHSHDDRYYTETEIDTKLAAKSDTTHNHTVSQIGDLTVSASELNYMDGVTSNVQSQLDSKQPSITGGASTIASSNLTTNRALVSNANGKVGVSLVTSTELGYLDGVTSNVQEQLDSKADYVHNHSASEITSGILNAARLPEASETAKGAVTTSSQTFAGNKTFTGSVSVKNLNAGESTSSIGNSLNPFDSAYVNTLNVGTILNSGSVLNGGSFKLTTSGTTTRDGVATLTVGNSVASGNNGNAQGTIEVYNEGTGSAIIRTGHDDNRNIYIYLPENGGTLITSDDLSGYAKSTHNHSASNITSGTLAVERGGTGNMNGYIQTGALSGSTVGALATAEGRNTTASGSYSHAEGNYTEATGSSSHAEGQNTIASGTAAHAEGENTTASGAYSHAEGENTLASSKHQHVQGKFNKEDTAGTYAHIVGNGTGTSSSKRSNAHTLDWNGNAWFAGNIYVGGTSQSSGATMLSSIATVTTAEYSALEEAEATNANTLYMITDAEEEVIPQIQFITWEEND